MSDDIETRLYGVLANRRWARDVASGWPYGGLHTLIDTADILMHDLTDEEWVEAMKAHPRIGERGGKVPESSDVEQSRVMSASASTLMELADENRRYEDRFGHVFLIFASGRSAEEILAELRRRIRNDPSTELEEAKRELRKIAKVRLGKLVS